jgi:hypothetical protein
MNTEEKLIRIEPLASVMKLLEMCVSCWYEPFENDPSAFEDDVLTAEEWRALLNKVRHAEVEYTPRELRGLLSAVFTELDMQMQQLFSGQDEQNARKYIEELLRVWHIFLHWEDQFDSKLAQRSKFNAWPTWEVR